MICPLCGSELPTGTSYCPVCGADVEAFVARSNPGALKGATQPQRAQVSSPYQSGYDVRGSYTDGSRGAIGMKPSGPVQVSYGQPLNTARKNPKWPYVVIVILLLIIAVAVALLIMRPWEKPEPSGTGGSAPVVSQQGGTQQGTQGGTWQPAQSGTQQPVQSQTGQQGGTQQPQVVDSGTASSGQSQVSTTPVASTPSNEQIFSELSSYYGRLSSYDGQISEVANNFNYYYVTSDPGVRGAYATAAGQLRDSLVAELTGVRAMAVPATSPYYSQWQNIELLYTYLYARVNVLAEAWAISAHSASPAYEDYSILAVDNDSTGKNRNKSAYEALYPVAAPTRI